MKKDQMGRFLLKVLITGYCNISTLFRLKKFLTMKPCIMPTLLNAPIGIIYLQMILMKFLIVIHFIVMGFIHLDKTTTNCQTGGAKQLICLAMKNQKLLAQRGE